MPELKQKYFLKNSSINFPEVEKLVQKYWDVNSTFKESVNLHKNKSEGINSSSDQKENNEFVFYDGPPFANGLPHYGHLLTGFIKDVYARYKTNKGKVVERRFGWDCHGLPAEMGAEKELKISGRAQIIKYGVDKFNNHCRDSVMKYADEWENYVVRQGRWVDFKNSYKTMDLPFMESVLWAFKELYKKDLIYKSQRVMPYSWACETPLSNFETRLDNSYRERLDKAVTVSFVIKNISDKITRLLNDKFSSLKFKNHQILAWTTTPWTLPSNLALAVNPDMDYVLVPKGDDCIILARFALKTYAKDLGFDIESMKANEDYVIISGKDLVDLEYNPLFDYFADHKNSFKILSADFVIEGDGTGIVHMAPGFGEDDRMVCTEAGIDLVCPVDSAGKFTDAVSDFKSMQVFDANDPIIINLKQKGRWIKTEQYRHNYPHCWRTDTPLIYKAVDSWYVKVTAFRDRMVELNKQINWIPDHVGEGLFGKWLSNAHDWAISRNRFWGTPIPVWISSDPNYPRMDVYGSVEELEKDFGVKVTDLHKHFIDKLERPNPDDPTGKSVMRRVDDVFDCWFESGSMPYAQMHYPFENKEKFENNFPADFIVEYKAQTRGWFYTLMVLSTAIFDKPPFLNCICHGVILDSTGQKLSKRLNNYADPIEIFDKYGSDALRTLMLSSSVVHGHEMLIDKDGKSIYDTLRVYMKPIWNAYNFFALYANIDQISASEIYSSEYVLDRYILSKLKIAVDNIDLCLEQYDTQKAYKSVLEFFDVLNNWYIRRSRKRFWQSESNQEKIAAYNTLYTCLFNMVKAIASLMPMLAEYIYLGLSNINIENLLSENLNNNKTSVHLTDFPTNLPINIDEDLVSVMDQIIDICSKGANIRQKHNIRTRQPLDNISIISQNSEKYKQFDYLILDELNIKKVNYSDDLSQYAEYKLVINFKVLAARLATENMQHKMKEIIAKVNKKEWSIVNDELFIDDFKLLNSEYELKLETLENEDNNNNDVIAMNNNIGVLAVDLNITQELYNEGVIRDLVRFIQNARKDADFQVQDRIELCIKTENSEFKQLINDYSEYITGQTLSVMVYEMDSEYDYSTECSIDNVKFILCLKKS